MDGVCDENIYVVKGSIKVQLELYRTRFMSWNVYIKETRENEKPILVRNNENTFDRFSVKEIENEGEDPDFMDRNGLISGTRESIQICCIDGDRDRFKLDNIMG